YLRVCQFATADIPSPDGSSTQQIILSNGVTLAPPISPVGPLIGPVEAPTINDQNLFTASTVSAHSATLKWEKPSLGNPIGYGVSVYTNLAVQGRSVYTRIATLNTGKTTVIVPPGILQSGTTYFFLITSVTDGRANIETSPNRLGFPAGNADIISAPITIGEL
ncbi:MAG TPA: fibronectin type III domain-containing protein, partial [Terriglobales bacterium]|nr:fibronectin type III domain-containing protein [Terriglobales bacterium]